MQDITITIQASISDDPGVAKLLVEYIMQTVRCIDPESFVTLTAPVIIPQKASK